jgi:hypothetical protein
VKRAALFLLLFAPLMPRAELGIDCPEGATVCTIDIHVLQALLQQAIQTPLPCRQRT